MRIPDKKSSNAPWFIGQRINERMPLQLGRRVASIDVGDFDSDIRMRLLARVSEAKTLI
jgi:hypothetical protein